MKAKFKILFSIEVLNKFFNSGRWGNIKISPLPETEDLLKKHEYSLRLIDNELLVIGKTDNNGKIYHAAPSYAKFSFVLEPQTANYLNYSNFYLNQSSEPVFYFHNLHNNEANSKHYLSASIKNYSNAITYNPGDFAMSLVDGKVYECIRLNNSGVGSIAPNDAEAEPAAPPAIEDKLYSANFWTLMGNEQFASKTDKGIVYKNIFFAWENCNGIYNVQTSLKQKDHSVFVYAQNPSDLSYTQLVHNSSINYNDLNDQVQVDLRSLASGAYLVQVNEDKHFVWLNNSNKHNGLRIYMDVYNLPSANSQAIFDAGLKPKRTKFTLSFAARRVLWQFKTRTGIIDNIEDLDAKHSFKPNGIRKFISRRAIPLSDVPLKSLVAKSGTLVIASPLPNPQPDKLNEQTNELFTSETFINF